MQFELTKIDGQNFVIQRVGKKEFTRTPRETIDGQIAAIADCYASIDGVHKAAQVTQQRIEEALIDGQPAAALRAELESAATRIDALTSDIAGTHENIRQIYQMLDAEEARALMAAQEARLAAMTEPYDKVLKESAQ